MSCPICYETIDDENKLILCYNCKLYRCEYCEENACCETVCGLCFKYKLTGDCNEEKFCDKCSKTVCSHCLALTGCQTASGVCKKCFEYKCQVCHKINLDINQTYLWDIKSFYPTCNACRNLY